MFKKTRLLSALLPILLLQACVPVVIAGAAASGMMLNDRRDVQAIMSDKQIQQRILSKFTSDPLLHQRVHITIAVLNGTILVCGQAPTTELRDRALRIIQSVPHRRTYDQIQITKSTSVQTRAEDTLVTTKVKTAMLARNGLRSMQIKIITENKVVYLMGIVDPDQGDLAAQVARRVPGVEKVVKLFEYIKH